MSIFKENDIRGLYPAEWNAETAFRIGCSLPDILPGEQFVVGRDGRESSREIYDRIICGLRERGKNVTSIGVVDTPAVYFAAGKYCFDGGIMVTASHNPPEYNGIKLIGRKAFPVGYKGGIEKLERLVEKNTVSVCPEKSCFGKDISLDISDDYAGYLIKFLKGKRKFKVVFDCSSGSMGRFIHKITNNFCGETVIINDEVDGSFPSHGPNPTLPENVTQIRERVLAENADAGFCFDGDGDRVVMVNEKGETVSPDLITAILGLFYFKYFPVRDPEKKVLIDIRSSRSISEYIGNLGGNGIIAPVGHTKIKKMMREENALFAGELTGHYYFRENYFCDSPWITIFHVLDVMAVSGKSLSSLNDEIMKYSFSGEKNFERIGNPEMIIQALLENYSDANILLLDGIRFDYPDWWFIIRKSGTEPLVRLVAEADNDFLLEEKMKELKSVIEGEKI